MTEADPMPRGGAKELMKSSDGRRYLSHLQKKYKHDIVQPHTDPHLFDQLYGQKIKKQEQRHTLDSSRARDLWKENADRRSFRNGDPARRRKIFI